MSSNKEKKHYIDDWLSYLRRSRNKFEEIWQRDESKASKVSHFKVIRNIGEGSYGRVVLAKKKSSYYAVKIISKLKEGKGKEKEHVLNERRVLLATKFPFIIHMNFFFSDSKSWYFATPFISGGDLWDTLRKVERFPEAVSVFYASQVLLAFEYLHYMRIIYRDLKPENILIDDDGYIKLADLGYCKKIEGRTYTFCGTAEYIAPEVMLSRGYGFAADWWAFGVLVYELCQGYTPFVSSEELETCKKITGCEYTMPNEFSPQLRDLVQKLLQKNPTWRLGCPNNGAMQIKNHRWFLDVDWLALLNRQLIPPFHPSRL